MSKKYILILVAVIAVFGAILFRYSKNYDFFGGYGAKESDMYVSSNPTGSGTSQASNTSKLVSENISYTDAVKKYGDRRIQFDIYCQGLPKNPVYKNNTTVLFDNRSGDARLITLDGVKYNFPGYGFKAITSSSAKLPHYVNVDCGSAQNVMTILLQK